MTGPAWCSGTVAEGWPGERPCSFLARPSGLCGVHEKQEARRLARAEQAGSTTPTPRTTDRKGA